MDLTTQCPQCGTTFLASLEQLQLRKGYIRCVQCAHIFDGYEAVVPAGSVASDLPDPIKSASPDFSISADQRSPSEPTSLGRGRTGDELHTPVSADATKPHIPQVVRQRREFTISGDLAPSIPEPSFGITDTNLPDSASAHASAEHVIADADSHLISDTDTSHTIGATVRMTRANIKRSPTNVEPDLSDSEQIYMAPRSERRRPDTAHGAPTDKQADRWQGLVRLLWSTLIVLGVVVFAVQLVYVFRAQIAEQVPALRPTLERMCDSLHCRVAWSRRPELIMITQSSLQMDSGSQDDDESDELTLHLTLRNAFDKPQEWPTLVLDLKDLSGALIARKELAAPVYLPQDVVAGPFPASSERRIQLPLTLKGLKVNGYQLTTFFP